MSESEIYVVYMWPSSCPSEKSVFKICKTHEEAEASLEEIATVYYKCEGEIETETVYGK